MSSYGNNITISYPGPDWEMLWPDGFGNWQLDIVGFLAILGEASILANAQVSALSRLFLLPRLLPAPQALLRVSRPDTLPPVPAHVTAVESGNKKTHVHHVASILLAASPEQLKKHSVRVVTVTKTPPKAPTRIDHILRGTANQPMGETTASDGTVYKPIPATVKARAAGPLTWVTVLSFAMTIIIFIASFVFGDGMALCATIALSLLSTVAGLANKWELSLPARPKSSKEPPKDTVVIRYPEGSFLIVKCNDEIARELFFAPEEINYTFKSPQTYRMLALIGSVLLMLGVILLANARLELQFAFAGAYLFLNAAHWAAAALPAKLHWDLSCYHVQEEGIEGGPDNTSFTDALWKCILVTKKIRWVRHNEAAPNTEAWKQWLKQARTESRRGVAVDMIDGRLIHAVPDWSHMVGDKSKIYRVPKWDARAAYSELARMQNDDDEELSADEGDLYFRRAETTFGAVQEVAAADNQTNGHANGHA